MMVVLLIAGLGLVLAGLLTVGLGVQLELSFGNTLILAGAIAACTGMILLGIWTVVRELKNIARRLGAGVAVESLASLQSAAASANSSREGGGFLFSRDQPAAENAGNAESAAQSASPLPWHEEAASRDRGRGDVSSAPEPVEAAPALKPRRNLLFSSSSRKERERAQAPTTEASAADLRPASPGPASPAAPSESSEMPPATFDDAWPRPGRSRAVESPPRRSGRAPSTFTEANAAAPSPPPPPDRDPPAGPSETERPVTVLKSGVVDGMAYSLYSDGSIEAQMPEGMMRFASIDELRAHLDQRP